MNDDPLFSMEQNIISNKLDPDTDTSSIKVLYLQNKKKSPKKKNKKDKDLQNIAKQTPLKFLHPCFYQLEYCFTSQEEAQVKAGAECLH